jgi:hypothetical protein
MHVEEEVLLADRKTYILTKLQWVIILSDYLWREFINLSYDQMLTSAETGA